MGLCGDSSQEMTRKPDGAGAYTCRLGVLGFTLGFPFAGLEREKGLICFGVEGTRRQLMYGCWSARLALVCSQGPPRAGWKVFLNPLCAGEGPANISASDSQ